MRRPVRATLRRGDLSRAQRRRLARRLRDVRRGWGPGCWARPGGSAWRDARRLWEAGLVAALVTRREWGVGRVREVELRPRGRR